MCSLIDANNDSRNFIFAELRHCETSSPDLSALRAKKSSLSFGNFKRKMSNKDLASENKGEKVTPTFTIDENFLEDEEYRAAIINKGDGGRYSICTICQNCFVHAKFVMMV